MRKRKVLKAVYLLCAAISAASFAPSVEAQIDFKLKVVDGGISLYGYSDVTCLRGGLDGCVLSRDTLQSPGTREFLGYARVNADAQTLSVAGHLEHTGVDEQYPNLGGAVANYTAQVYADVPPGAYASVRFRHSTSITWNMSANEAHGQASWYFSPYHFSNVGGGYSIDPGNSSNAPPVVSFSTITAEARAFNSSQVGGGVVVDGGKTYYFLGDINTYGRIEIQRPSPGGATGTFSTSIDNIEVRHIGKVLKKLPEGDAQTGLVTKPLPKGLNVRLINDDTGIPVANEPVTFTVLNPVNGASLSATSASTDLSGYATTYLTLGASTGTYIVRATCPGCIAEENTVFFMATAKGIELRKIPGDGTAPIGRQTLNPLKVQAYNPITNTGEAGYIVDFSVLSTPAGGETAKLATSQSITNKFGIASSEFALGESIGDYTIKARCESCLGNPETYLTVTGTARVEDTHSSAESKRIIFPPPPSGGVSIVLISFETTEPDVFSAINVPNSRVGVLRGDTERRFKGVAVAPGLTLTDSDYVWSGNLFSGTGQTITVPFNNVGTYDLTLTVKGKSRTAVITVAAINSSITFGGWISQNIVYATNVLSCATAALVWAGGSTNDVYDAMRHAYWNACITNTVSAEIASAATSAHEFSNIHPELTNAPPNTPPSLHNENVMDLENNAIGRNIGGNYPYLIGMTIIQEEIKATAHNGVLTVIDPVENQYGAGLLLQSR